MGHFLDISFRPICCEEFIEVGLGSERVFGHRLYIVIRSIHHFIPYSSLATVILNQQCIRTVYRLHITLPPTLATYSDFLPEHLDRTTHGTHHPPAQTSIVHGHLSSQPSRLRRESHTYTNSLHLGQNEDTLSKRYGHSPDGKLCFIKVPACSAAHGGKILVI